MRAILHIGLFALALTAVGQASADDGDRRRERRTTIVMAPQVEHRVVRPVRAPVQPATPQRHRLMVRNERARGMVQTRREVFEEQRDHDEIVRISNHWTRATQTRNTHAQRNAERQARAWIDREIAESNHKPDHGRYVQRLHALRRQVSASNGGHGRGRGRQRFTAHKAEVLGELVRLSEAQVHRARARVRGQLHLALAYR